STLPRSGASSSCSMALRTALLYLRCPRPDVRWRHADGAIPRAHGSPAMLKYIIRRVMVMVPTLLAISAIVFIIIKLPPGDYLTTLIAELTAQGETGALQRVEELRREYGLDQP